jgi:lysozyme family protein
MSNFDSMFDLVAGHEGEFTNNAEDPGNWTTGKVGVGTCRGTKFGISAAAYPDIDIVDLTLDEAKALYRRDYWDRFDGDRLPGALALLVFDAAINNGTGRAVSWLQSVARVPQDGIVGPETLAAVDRLTTAQDGATALCSEFLAQRLTFMAALPTWKTFGLGWARRLCKLPYETLPYLER